MVKGMTNLSTYICLTSQHISPRYRNLCIRLYGVKILRGKAFVVREENGYSQQTFMVVSLTWPDLFFSVGVIACSISTTPFLRALILQAKSPCKK